MQMPIFINKESLQNFNDAIRKEWLETNGLGGWASSTLTGAHSRRYHGLLVAAMQPPVRRMVLLSKLDETIEISGKYYDLSSNVYTGTVFPKGYEHLKCFTKDLFPVFDFAVAGIHIRKTIMAVNGENTTLIFYEILRAPCPFSLQLLTLFAGRDYHSLIHANDAICRESSFKEGTFHIRPYDDVPDLFIRIPGADFKALPRWYYHFEYLEEKKRGLDFGEDLFSYGVFQSSLSNGDCVGVIVSTQDPSGRDPLTLYDQEKRRRLDLLKKLPKSDKFSKMLVLAADQFVVRREKDLRSIIAGYHWFTDWGRDTMIALPGITLVTGRFEDARRILLAFAHSVSQGMLPNRFPDTGRVPEHNTADAALWFFVAVYKYLQYTEDECFVSSELMPVLEDIIRWHDLGTRYQIHTDADGLLCAGEPGIPLTWMDAKVGDWVVTPRHGKPVEINALWYNALKIYASMARRFDRKACALKYEKRAGHVKKRFLDVFWNADMQCLYDYVDKDYQETAIRPNQIFALSLPFPLLSKERARAVLRVVEKRLLTPFGLRSLDPRHHDYVSRYEGDRLARDGAYHQGTIWGWLIGPFITALVRIKGDTAGKRQAATILKGMSAHFKDAGIGSISEIFDAESPHEPRGCIAQAWSVSEILRAYIEDVLD